MLVKDFVQSIITGNVGRSRRLLPNEILDLKVAFMSTETVAAVADADNKRKLALEVDVQTVGPCRRHVRVKIAEAEIQEARKQCVKEFGTSAAVPGFRVGKVPAGLIERRFNKEISDRIREKLLIESLEQLGEDKSIEPIDEPQFDVASLQIPDTGDFEYEFDVEVRPEFEIPAYSGLSIKRPVHTVTESEIEKRIRDYQIERATERVVDRPVAAGDYARVTLEFRHADNKLSTVSNQRVVVRPSLKLRDGEITGFDQLLIGAKAGDILTTSLVVTPEAENVELRGETIQVNVTVVNVVEFDLKSVDEIAEEFALESAEEVRNEVRKTLERQVTYRQRQETRRQVLEQMTASADWELPESLVRRQVENALRREMLEMQQAGFSFDEIRARENELRQKSLTTTRQALKEHFVLDRVATKESIEVEPYEIDAEIGLMAYQQMETPRKLRARLQKNGMIENLEAQIRERKAVDHILAHATFEDIPMEISETETSFALPYSVAGTSVAGTIEDSQEEDSEE
ncbi:Trigger factor [Planctopirus ephydatiae]|uniref:Trigger factor n=2 Tax=Planctopirus ephydatiae TaxID=2528019 RepID=A0A518GU45_9PLAN|nr:Trigger factor [Planctopirus ephydatiae]